MLDVQYQADPNASLLMLCGASAQPTALSVMDGQYPNFQTPWVDANVMSGVFAAGTLIDTPTGKIAIETLATGDLIPTFKNGKSAVQGCIAVPDHCIPDQVIRIRSGFLNAKADLITLPQQPVRLDHWLGSALFGTKFPFVTVSQVCLEGKIESVPKAGVQFFRLFLGVCDAITANGVLCISEAPGATSLMSRKSSCRNFDYRILDSAEVSQALSAGSFFRKVRRKGEC